MLARTFSDAYEANRRNAAGAAFEADAVAVAIADFIREDFPAGSSGTATKLSISLLRKSLKA